jgi:uncharacterized membrane protein YhhN
MEDAQPPVIPQVATEVLPKLSSQGDILDRLNFWKLAFAKCLCLCLLAAVASIQASVNGIIALSDMTGTQIFGAVVALVGAVGAVILAFLSDTIQKLSAKADEEKKKVETQT